MSVVDDIREGMCGKKRAYDTYDDALFAYWAMVQKWNDAQDLTFYKCEFCGKYHVGNSRSGMGRRIKMIREAQA